MSRLLGRDLNEGFLDAKQIDLLLQVFKQVPKRDKVRVFYIPDAVHFLKCVGDVSEFEAHLLD